MPTGTSNEGDQPRMSGQPCQGWQAGRPVNAAQLAGFAGSSRSYSLLTTA